MIVMYLHCGVFALFSGQFLHQEPRWVCPAPPLLPKRAQRNMQGSPSQWMQTRHKEQREWISYQKKWSINFLCCCSTGTPRCTRRRGTGTPGWLGFWSARDVMPLSRTRWGQSPNSYHASFSNHFSVGGNYLDTFFCPEKLGFSKLPFRLTQIGGMAVGSCEEPINSPLLLLLLFWREITEGVLASAKKVHRSY